MIDVNVGSLEIANVSEHVLLCRFVCLIEQRDFGPNDVHSRLSFWRLLLRNDKARKLDEIGLVGVEVRSAA